MADRSLVEAYLERLAEAVPLPVAERDAALEEIAGYLTDATDALTAAGLAPPDAQRRALRDLGAPERLAADLAAAHRTPRHLLEAAGTALTVSLGTTIRSFVLLWALILAASLLFGLAVFVVRTFVSQEFLAMDWSPMLDGLLPAFVAGATAYAVGRSLVGPVARAARRPVGHVRPVILVVGCAVAATVGLTVVEARWTPPTALLMASLPVWFAVGMSRPNLLPGWFPGSRLALLALLGLIVVPMLMLLYLGGTATYFTSEGGRAVEWDPAEVYGHIAPLVSIERPPIATGSASGEGPFEGPGPVVAEYRGSFRSSSVAAGWSELRLEVWPGMLDAEHGPVVDETASGPIVTVPIEPEGRRVEGQITFQPTTGREAYYVAITGADTAGQRWLLAWPSYQFWVWRGTPLELFVALAR